MASPARLALVTGPLAEPITLVEAQAHLRLETDFEDTYTPGCIADARDWVEGHTGRVLYRQKWRLALGSFPDEPLTLPKPPFVSIPADGVTYRDSAGNLRTLDPSLYVCDGTDYGVFALTPYCSWPETYPRPGAVQITFWAGYTDGIVDPGAVLEDGSPAPASQPADGDPKDQIPGTIKRATKLMLAHFYENRESEFVGGQVSKFEVSATRLLSLFRDERY